MLMLGCATPEPVAAPAPPSRPILLPADAVEIHTDARDLRVGDTVISPTAELLADPVEGLHEPLINALTGRARVWVHIADDTPWLMTRKLVNSARKAGAEVWLGTDDRAWPPSRVPRSVWGRPNCEPGSAPVVGVDRALTLEIHRGGDGTWMLASVRFRPLVERADGQLAEDDLSPACWAGASCDLLEGVGREACLSATGDAPARVEVAGEVGCVLPIAKQPSQVEEWSRPLGELVAAWGFGGDDDVMLIPEATVPFSAIAAVFDAFARQGQPPPALGTPLVEGNEGAPICDVAIRDRLALDRAAGAWLGARLRLDDDAH